MIKGKPGEPGKPGKDLRVCKTITNTPIHRQISQHKYINHISITLFSSIVISHGLFVVFICRC